MYFLLIFGLLSPFNFDFFKSATVQMPDPPIFPTPFSYTLKTEAAVSSETSVTIYQTTRSHLREDSNVQSPPLEPKISHNSILDDTAMFLQRGDGNNTAEGCCVTMATAPQEVDRGDPAAQDDV
jgi:hypothetical protein